MKPVKTEDCNVLYKGPTPDIGDLLCHRASHGTIRSTWEPDEEERALLVAGGRVQLTIYREPIPPVLLRVVAKEDSEPSGPHGWKIEDLKSTKEEGDAEGGQIQNHNGSIDPDEKDEGA